MTSNKIYEFVQIFLTDIAFIG